MDGWKMEERSFDEVASMPVELLSRKRSELLHGHKCFTFRLNLTFLGPDGDCSENRSDYFQNTIFDGSMSRKEGEKAVQELL
jgi:hypothetical protein